MRYAPQLLLMLLAAALLSPGEVRAQARGPAAEEVREDGQEILSRREKRQQESQQEASLDETTRAARLDELDAWLRRLPGRYRIKGTVRLGREGATFDNGIGDCTGVGDGPGVNCIINAKWPFLTLNKSVTNVTPSSSEYLNTMRPAVLVFGLSLDPPGVVSQMVSADSVVLSWFGRLDENTLASTATHRCTDRCIFQFEVTAGAQSDHVTFEMRIPAGSITFTMERDPDARAEKPLKALKAR